MKRILIILLTFAVLFSLAACSQESEEIVSPVNFYYRNTTVTFGSESGVISAEVAESKDYGGKILDILNVYIKGPYKDNHRYTFPIETVVLSCTVSGDTAYIEVNNVLARLTGMDLTIACACLAKTTMELIDVTSVNISAADVNLDGNTSITISQDSILLSD